MPLIRVATVLTSWYRSFLEEIALKRKCTRQAMVLVAKFIPFSVYVEPSREALWAAPPLLRQHATFARPSTPPIEWNLGLHTRTRASNAHTRYHVRFLPGRLTDALANSIPSICTQWQAKDVRDLGNIGDCEDSRSSRAILR